MEYGRCMQFGVNLQVDCDCNIQLSETDSRLLLNLWIIKPGTGVGYDKSSKMWTGKYYELWWPAGLYQMNTINYFFRQFTVQSFHGNLSELSGRGPLRKTRQS